MISTVTFLKRFSTFIFYSLKFVDRWCQFKKINNISQIIVFVIDDVSVNDFEENGLCFPETHKIFEDAVEMANPLSDGISMALSLAYTPISVSMRKKLSFGRLLLP